MYENSAPTPKLIWIEEQPDFPAVDLTDANTDSLKYLLANEPGVEAHGKFLEEHQRALHILADKALNIFAVSGRVTRYSEAEYRPFTHGFATMEAITTTVRPPSAYDLEVGVRRVRELCIDETSSEEREFATLLQTDLSEETSKTLATTHDRLDSDLLLADVKARWEERFHNTSSVILELGLLRNESLSELRCRLAGACIAHFLQDPS